MDKSILTVIADNPALMQAVKQTVLKQFDFSSLDGSVGVEKLGQLVLSRLEGMKAVESAFKEIERHKTVPEKTLEPNRAR